MQKKENKITIKTIPRKDYREFYVTLNNLSSEGTFFQETLEKLEKKDILVNKVVFFGNAEKIAKLLPEVRGKYPYLVIGNSLPDEVVSAYVSGIEISSGKSREVKMAGEIIGRYFDLPDFEYLNVPGIYLKNKQKVFEQEAKGEYEKIAEVLKQYDFSAKNIYRFWNYMDEIWQNYSAFNEARNAYFAQNKIAEFPAATGIEAKLGFEKKISLGFEAIKPKEEKGFSWETISFNLQAEPQKYDSQVSGLKSGPKFSRAVLADFPGSQAKKFYISGISSANELGEASLADNLPKNVAYVMHSFEKLLEKGGFSLADLVSTHVYSKNKEISLEFEKLYATKNWQFPYNPVFTNICRESFLFEIEGIAADNSEDYSFE